VCLNADTGIAREAAVGQYLFGIILLDQAPTKACRMRRRKSVCALSTGSPVEQYLAEAKAGIGKSASAEGGGLIYRGAGG